MTRGTWATALTSPLGGLCRYRVGNCRMICHHEGGVLRVLVVRVARRDKVYR